jgi:serine O-acetyltransferase
MSKFSQDIARYRANGQGGKNLWLEPAVWAVATYRLGNWLHVKRPFILIRIPLKIVAFFAYKFCEVFMEMQISSQATIGEGLYIGHIGGVHVNPEAIIGKNCDIAHRVTIGASAMGRKGAPTVGDEVYIGTGATLIGKIKVGSRAKIGANTLVIDNIPEGATVMGVPGRIMVFPSMGAAPKPPAPTAVATGD